METPDRPTGFGVNGLQPESVFEMRTLEEGSILKLADGRTARVLDNPHDGVWLVCEAIDVEELAVEDAETVLCYDIAALIRRGGPDA